jgi:hypothetical protein
MSLSALAWGPGHPSIVTYDEKELLAYDSDSEGPKWRFELARPIAGVVLADATFLDLGDAASPFRTPAAVGAVLAVDDEGRLHAVDASSGRKIGDVGPFGAPRSLAASAVGQGIALAVPGKVCVWRKGARSETMLEATAVAFSNDGATLAVATEQGVVKMFDLTGLDGQESLREVFAFDARGPVNDLVQHPSGAWLVAGSRATLLVDGKSDRSLEKIPVGAKRVRFDSRGTRVAVQLSQKQVLVYEWPQLSVLTRIEYTERPVRGIEFGKGDWLGVAMDHGDGNKIDVITNAVHRTDTHPGRQHRSWSLYVEGGRKPAAPSGELTARDEDAIRRMHEPTPVDSGGFGRGGRIGIITVISLCLIGLKLCVRLGSSGSSYSSSYSSSSGYTPPSKCDQACATQRVQSLVKSCATAGCGSDANEAATALAAGDCAKTQAAIARIPRDTPGAPLLGVEKLLAEIGVREACDDGAITPKAKQRIVHPRLVRLVGAQLSETSEDIPESDPDGERPRTAWTSSDGSLFVGTVTGAQRKSPYAIFRRRTPAGKWEVGKALMVGDADVPVSIVGRGPEVYAAAGDRIVVFDGKTWDEQKSPGGPIAAMAATKDDLFVTTIKPGGDKIIHRRAKGEWVTEKLSDMEIRELRAGGPAVWALGTATGNQAVLARSADGRWTVKAPAVDGGSVDPFLDLWVSPSGDAFLFNETTTVRVSANGAKWVAEEMPFAGLLSTVWGRSSTDVFAASYSRIFHYDGKTWAPTPYEGKVAALSGTAKEVFVLRADD